MKEKTKTRRKRVRDTLQATLAGITKAVSYYGTATKIVQLLPVLFGFLILAFSPTAWLSATLRRYALIGIGVGGLLGAVAFYLAASLKGRFHRIALGSLILFAAAGAMLRLHLAIVDVAFIERWRLFEGIYDFYLGTGNLQEQLYNFLAGVLFALTLFAATLGLPAGGIALRRARATQATPPAKVQVTKSKVAITSELESLVRMLETLLEENDDLKKRLGEEQALSERLHMQLASAVGDRVQAPARSAKS